MVTSSTVGSGYIVLRSEKANKTLVAARNACGDMSAAIHQLHSRVGDDVDYEGLDYSEKIGRVVVELLYDGVIRRDCYFKVRNDRTYGLYGPYEGELLVLLSSQGDVAIGFAGKAITPWPAVVVEGSFRPDVLLVDDIPLAISQEVVVAQK
jgi:hypothetical protein